VFSEADASSRRSGSQRSERPDTQRWATVQLGGTDELIWDLAMVVYHRLIEPVHYVDRRLTFELKLHEAPPPKAFMSRNGNRVEHQGLHLDRAGAPLDLELISDFVALLDKVGVSSDGPTQADHHFLDRKERAVLVKAVEHRHGLVVAKEFFEAVAAGPELQPSPVPLIGLAPEGDLPFELTLPPDEATPPLRSEHALIKERTKRLAAYLATRCSRTSAHITKRSVEKALSARLSAAIDSPRGLASAGVRLGSLWSSSPRDSRFGSSRSARTRSARSGSFASGKRGFISSWRMETEAANGSRGLPPTAPGGSRRSLRNQSFDLGRSLQRSSLASARPPTPDRSEAGSLRRRSSSSFSHATMGTVTSEPTSKSFTARATPRHKKIASSRYNPARRLGRMLGIRSSSGNSGGPGPTAAD